MALLLLKSGADSGAKFVRRNHLGEYTAIHQNRRKKRNPDMRNAKGDDFCHVRSSELVAKDPY